MPAAQQAVLNLIIASFGLAALLAPVATLLVCLVVLYLIFFTLIAWRSFLVLIGICVRLTDRSDGQVRGANPDAPIYSVLVPVYREARILPQLARALGELNWPADKLDVQILLEEDDTDTIAVARRAAFPENTRLTIVPPGGPRTKPNALNYGLERARGEFVTVYDAEDLPHPDQLRAVSQAFRHISRTTVCLQCPLVADNGAQHWLAAQWGLEYAVQFGLLLPALSTYRMPLLIGGTSNHFRTSALLALGGWDAWNVTEDADLGIRIARAGLNTGTIHIPTHEDAPTDFKIWLAQRSRWIKGYMQTWLVLMRNPAKALRQLGFVRFCATQLTLGGAIIAPVFFLPCSLLVIAAMQLDGIEIGTLGLSLLMGAIGIGLIGDLTARGPLTTSRLVAALTRWAYWPLHSPAAYRAIWELANNPFFWAKTPHHPRHAETQKTCSIGSSVSASPAA
ncbi:MAG: glycosyltransferase [Hyphomonadaceae bacterium]|nr:glycosyltransferase [Hyphomonadaceae bacterium]